MNTSAPHLPARPVRHRHLPDLAARTADAVRSLDPTALRRSLRRFDDHPGVDLHASPSEVALREIDSVHSLHR